MEYIRIKNIEKYQPQYKDGRRLLWIRWDVGAMRDYRISKLTPTQKWLFIGLICLQTENTNGIPNDPIWLSKQLGIEKSRISKQIQMLQTYELIVTSCNNNIESSSPTIHTDIHTDNTVHYPFEEIYLKYPKKVGKKEAERHFKASVKIEEDWQNINKALENYLKSERVAKGFIQNASTWFNNWQDWVDFKEDLCPKCKGNGKYTSKTGYEITCDCPAGMRKQ